MLEARRSGGAQRQLTGLLVERRRHRQQHVLLRQRQLLLRAAGDVVIEGGGEMAQVRGRRVDRRDVRDFRRERPRAGSVPCGSRRRTTARTSRWRRRRTGFSAPRRRASSPTTSRRRRVPGQGRGCPRESRARPAGRETMAAAPAGATSPGFTSCGYVLHAEPEARSLGERRVDPASAQLVVPRSMPTTKRCVSRWTDRRLRLRPVRRWCGRLRQRRQLERVASQPR